LKKKNNNPVLKILFGLFIIFMVLYIANMSGYYESKIRDRVTITEEGIKEFEEKVKNGDKIDVSSFLNTDRVDYTSSMSNLGEYVTNGIENVISTSFDVFKNIINSLF